MLQREVESKIKEHSSQLEQITQLPNELKFNENFSNTSNAYQIKKQSDFDNLKEILKTNDNIEISGGMYFVKNTNSITNELDNRNIKITNRPGEKVIITSCNKIITPTNSKSNGNFYIANIDVAFDEYTLFLDENLEKINISTTGIINDNKINQFESEVLKNNDLIYECKAKLPSELSFLKNKTSDYFINSIIDFKAWFVNIIGKNIRTDEEYIYFTVPQEDYEKRINWEYTKYSRFANFEIINYENENDLYYKNNKLYIPKKYKKLYICDNKFSLLSVNNSSPTKLEMNGLYFNGMYNIICGENVKNLNVINNKIKNISENGINILSDLINYDELYSNNVVFENNECENIGCSSIKVASMNCKIKKNKIKNTGLVYGNNSAIDFKHGKDFEIEWNKIINAPLNHIRSGDTRSKDYNISGKIMFNECYNTDEYNQYIDKNCLCDGGGIYVFTHSDNTEVKHNIVHDIYGLNDKWGIYGDDGAYNMHTHGNLVYNTQSEAITMRYVETTEDSNKFNTFGENIILGGYRYGSKPDLIEETGRAVQTKNVLLNNGGINNYKTLQNTLVKSDDDVSCATFINGVIYADISNISNSLSNFVLSRIKNTSVNSITTDQVALGKNKIQLPNTIEDLKISAYRNLRLFFSNYELMFQSDINAIYPNVDTDTMSLGTSSKRFANLYAKNIGSDTLTSTNSVTTNNVNIGKNIVCWAGTTEDLILHAYRNLRIKTKNGASEIVYQTNDVTYPTIYPTTSDNILLGTGSRRWREINSATINADTINLVNAPNVTSKRELKENIKCFDDEKAYKGIQEFNIYTYNFKNGDGEQKLGAILDELPEECISKSNEGVDLYAYTSYCISALKKAISEIEMLKYEIEQLKSNS